jgi:hypothetical protein
MISYGHIHFGSHALASEFYNAMNQTTFKFGCRNVRFSAAKKFSGKLIIYQVCPHVFVMLYSTFINKSNIRMKNSRRPSRCPTHYIAKKGLYLYLLLSQSTIKLYKTLLTKLFVIEDGS